MKVLLATITLAMIVVVYGRGRRDEERNCGDAYRKAYIAYLGCWNECGGGDLTRKAAYEVRAHLHVASPVRYAFGLFDQLPTPPCPQFGLTYSTEIGIKAGLFAKLQPGRDRKRINAT